MTMTRGAAGGGGGGGGEVYDVIVVGGGVCGLVCAVSLRREGLRVLVLEGSEHVGGRSSGALHAGDWSVEQDGVRYDVDMGAAFIMPKHSGTKDLLADLGDLPTFRPGALTGVTDAEMADKKGVLEFDGQTHKYAYAGGPLHGFARENVATHKSVRRVVNKLARTAARVPSRVSHRLPDAAMLDAVSVGWVEHDSCTTQESARIVDALVRNTLGCSPMDVSLLHFLSFLASYHADVDGLFTRHVLGRDASCIIGGAPALCERLAQVLQADHDISGEVGEIGPIGELFLHAKVHSLRHVGTSHDVDGTVSVQAEVGHTRTERQFTAKHVVVALPPPLRGEHTLQIYPAPPSRWRKALERFHNGATIVVAALYKTPFWLQDGLCGEVVADGFTGPLTLVRPQTVPASQAEADAEVDAAATSAPPLYALIGYIGGDLGRMWSSVSDYERRNAVLEQLAAWFGQHAADPLHYLEHDWTGSDNVGGFPCAFAGTGVMTELRDELYRPFGRVHFASADTASHYQGTLEGAIRAGHDVCRNIVDLRQGRRLDVALEIARAEAQKGKLSPADVGESVGAPGSSSSNSNSGSGGRDDDVLIVAKKQIKRTDTLILIFLGLTMTIGIVTIMYAIDLLVGDYFFGPGDREFGCDLGNPMRS